MNNDIILTEFARVINSDRYQYTESDIFLMENMQNKAKARLDKLSVNFTN
mgnify:CR=1 FL=1